MESHIRVQYFLQRKHTVWIERKSSQQLLKRRLDGRTWWLRSRYEYLRQRLHAVQAFSTSTFHSLAGKTRTTMTIPRRIYKIKTRLTEAQYKRLENLQFFRGVKVIGWHVEDRSPIVYMSHIGKSFTVTKDGHLRPTRKKHNG
jgi:hypothetical protein